MQLAPLWLSYGSRRQTTASLKLSVARYTELRRARHSEPHF
jgi:hypothetical protein